MAVLLRQGLPNPITTGQAIRIVNTISFRFIALTAVFSLAGTTAARAEGSNAVSLPGSGRSFPSVGIQLFVPRRAESTVFNNRKRHHTPANRFYQRGGERCQATDYKVTRLELWRG